METHDFSNAKVGDKVSHLMFGDGEIINIDDALYPIDVKFKNQTLAFLKMVNYGIQIFIHPYITATTHSK